MQDMGAISTAVPSGEWERQRGGESRMGSSYPTPLKRRMPSVFLEIQFFFKSLIELLFFLHLNILLCQNILHMSVCIAQ